MFWYLGWDEAILAGRLSVDLSRLPAMADVSPARGPMLVKLALAVLWFLLSLVVIAPFAPTPFRVKAVMVILPVAGLVMIAMSLYGLMRRRHVRFGEHRVLVRDRRWFRSIDWSAPYIAFQGVRLRKHRVNSGPYNRIVHIIELKHPNTGLSLPLLVTDQGPPPRKALADAARMFGLSVIEENDEREAFDAQSRALNRPLSALAHTHDLAGFYDADEPVPHELRVRHGAGADGEMLSVAIRPRRPQRIWQALLVLGPAVLLAFALRMGSTVILVDGATFAMLSAFITAVGLRRCRRLAITREELIYGAPEWNPIAPSPQRLRLADIEGVYIDSPRSSQGHHIEVHAGRDAIHLGYGLSSASLDWLRRFIISAVATA